MIDWQALAAKLASRQGTDTGRVRASAVTGGDINRAFRLETGTGRYFIKLNRAELESMFIAERSGLEAIRASGAIRVPRVYLTGREAGYSYIAMEYIEISANPDAGRLARALAAMHGCCNELFGFDSDNTIGSNAQFNSLAPDWVEFWRRQRLGYQLELARRNGLDARLIDSGERLSQQLGQFFVSYRPRASLLHGDLWSGNWGADEQGDPVIYDPACYYGDHEADLAMMELFGRPSERFFAVYHERFAIDAGYSQRRDLYNLYHLLNHANLFGGGYAGQAQRVIDSLLAGLG